jgi:hypothetical protein
MQTKEMIEVIKDYNILKKEDYNFFLENSEHLKLVFKNTWIWRTDSQKKSIISDWNFPTDHSKFHQSILEQKVQTDQAFYLAKDYEIKKIEIEELELENTELNDNPKDSLKKRKNNIEIKYKLYEIEQMKIAMEYRIKEIKGWKGIQDNLLKKMKEQGMADEIIWDKDKGEQEAMFFKSLGDLPSIKQTTDTAEYNNLLSFAHFAVKEAIENNKLDEYVKRCNASQIEGLKILGFKIDQKNI